MWNQDTVGLLTEPVTHVDSFCTLPFTMSNMSLEEHCCGKSLYTDFDWSPISLMLPYLAWQMLIVLTDVPNISPPLEISEKAYLEIPPFDANDPATIQSVLDYYSNVTKPPSTFIIACSATTTVNILQMVNTHDSQYNEQGVLTYHHRWLILSLHNGTFHDVEKYVNNITHLSILLWEKTSGEVWIYSALWKTSGRRIELSAQISNNSMTGEIFPTLKYGLNGRRFSALTILWDPFASKKLDHYGKPQYVGLCIEILKAVAENMNFTFVVEEPPDGQWGAVINGTWTGIVGQLAYKKADMMSAALSIQVNRGRVMDFTYPFYIEETGIVYKQTPNYFLSSFLFIRPYKWQVWFCLAAFTICISLLLRWMGHILHTAFPLNNFGDITLSQSFWITFGSAFNQGPIHLSKRTSVRLVSIYWVVTCIILSAIYTGNLVALLAVEVELPPFNSLEELSTQREYRFGVQGGSAYTGIMKNEKGVYATMWEKMVNWDTKGIPVLSTSHKAHTDYVDKGGYAYFTDLTAAMMHARTSCDLRIYTGHLFSLQFAMGFQNNSAYTNEASKVIARLGETGFLVKWKSQFWPKEKGCGKGLSSSKNIGLSDLLGLLYIVTCLLLLSFVVLIIEIISKTKYCVVKITPAD